MRIDSIVIPLVILAAGLATAHARTWTDIQGRSIEAELVRVDGGDPVVNLRGKETKLPLAKLSAADQEFVAKWQADHPAVGTDAAKAQAPTTGAITLAGVTIQPGPKQHLIEKPFPADVVKDLKEKGETMLKLAVAVPADFDPAKPMKVFVVSTAVNNDAERAAGNIAKFNMYAGACTEQGWVCMAADTDKGFPSTAHTIAAACELMAKEWPGFARGRFAVGGFSGGSKACFFNAAWLGKNKYTLAGAYLGGCNHDTSAENFEKMKTPSGAYRKLKVYVGSGKTDKIATPEQGEEVEKSLKENGIRNVRLELHDGGHAMSREQFIAALQWFGEMTDK
jgi:predicted esterase